jgi:NAD(P)-dependent dehydrogenase (short-subunit alcohol dehydrogenase family)
MEGPSSSTAERRKHSARRWRVSRPRATHNLAADLSDHDGIERLEAEIPRCFGTLHVLIHSAGILGLKVPLAEYPAEVWGDVTWSTTTTPEGLRPALILHKDAGER